MKKEIKKLWIKALNSGKFKQTSGLLKDKIELSDFNDGNTANKIKPKTFKRIAKIIEKAL